jgi:precorrin-2 dehydrogenase/sirohydrochlorin ferrochelatase
MTNYYPMMLNLTGKRVVVIGGGTVAARKIKTLLEAKAEITVVSPELHDTIIEELPHPLLTWKQKHFEPEDLIHAFLIIAATNYTAVNLDVYEKTNNQQLINVVDQPDLSNFIVPASIRRGKLTLAVSTSGAMPGLARKIKQKLATEYDEIYEDYLNFLEISRQQVLQEITDITKRRQLLQSLLQPIFLELTQQASYDKRDRLFVELLQKED